MKNMKERWKKKGETGVGYEEVNGRERGKWEQESRVGGGEGKKKKRGEDWIKRNDGRRARKVGGEKGEWKDMCEVRRKEGKRNGVRGGEQ